MEAIMEAKSDSKKYLKGEIGLEDLAVKFVEKLESALTSQVDPKDSNLPNPSMDLNIMNVSSNQIHSRVKLTVAVSIFQAQLDRCGWEIARYNQILMEIKLSILVGPDYLTKSMLDTKEMEDFIIDTNVALKPLQRKIAVTPSNAYNSP